MSRTGRVVVAHDQNFEIREFPVPEPEAKSVLLKQELAGICGTDLHNWQNRFPEEIFLGHENVGTVIALGSDTKTDYLGNPLAEGDRVVFHPRNSSVAYGFRTTQMEYPPFSGGFGDYIYLNDPDTCMVVTSAPAEVAVLAEPFAVGVHAAARAGIQIGDTVIVQGSGAIGLLTMVAARISGAARVIMVGGPSDRLELARKMGADVTIDIMEHPNVEQRAEVVMASTPRGEGADVVFECAGFLPAIPEGLGYVKQDGTFVEVGHFVDVGAIEINPNRLIVRRNMRIEAIWGSRFPHLLRGMTILERNEYPFAELISHKLPLSRVADGFAALNGKYELDGRTAFKIAVDAGAA